MSEEKTEDIETSDVGAAAPETARNGEKETIASNEQDVVKDAPEKVGKGQTRKQPQKNPKFKDLEETGKWGEFSRTELYTGIGILVLVVIGVIVALVLTLGDDDDNNDKQEPAPTAAPTIVDKFQIIIKAIENSETIGNLADESNLPVDVAFYDNLADQDSAPAHQRAMSWVLSTDYDELGDLDEYPIRFALACMYYELGGDAWTRNANWLSDEDIYEWEGITCEVGTDDFRELFLGGNNLVGTIPEEIALLQGVTKIWLSTNQLSGEIPGDSFGELTDLSVLYLKENQLTGSVPASLNKNSNLNTLFVQENSLTGSWPFCPSAIGAPRIIEDFGLDCLNEGAGTNVRVGGDGQGWRQILRAEIHPVGKLRGTARENPVIGIV
eukprot:scaffold6638_cov127-Cylindrotheca_fusiformis.AAC.30